MSTNARYCSVVTAYAVGIIGKNPRNGAKNGVTYGKHALFPYGCPSTYKQAVNALVIKGTLPLDFFPIGKQTASQVASVNGYEQAKQSLFCFLHLHPKQTEKGFSDYTPYVVKR